MQRSVSAPTPCDAEALSQMVRAATARSQAATDLTNIDVGRLTVEGHGAVAEKHEPGFGRKAGVCSSRPINVGQRGAERRIDTRAAASTAETVYGRLIVGK